MRWHGACLCAHPGGVPGHHTDGASCMQQVVLKKANVNREEVSTVVKDKINEFALRGFRALGVSVADGDQSGPDECAPGPFCRWLWLASFC